MTFVHPFVLILLFLPLSWLVWSLGHSRQRLGITLKALSIASILVALAEPRVTLPRTKTATLILVDTSRSLSTESLARASALVKQMERSKGSNWIKIVPFTSETRSLSAGELAGGIQLTRTASGAPDGTNLERALTESLSAVPNSYIPRIVLMSDGNENEGSSARAIAELQRLHVPVDTIPLSGQPADALQLQALSLPHEAYANEQIPVDLTINSPRLTSATVELSAEGKALGSNSITLQPGVNTVRVHARVDSSGATSIAGKVTAEHLGDLQFEQAIKLKRPKILYISEDPAGSEVNLLDAFKKADFELSRDISQIQKDLESFQLVILNNLDLNALGSDKKARLEQYVRSGGGLLLIGGERQIYKEDKQMDAFDRVLPAKLAPPKSPEGTCVALIIDKSSSMEGRKVELARLSAIGVVDHLRPIDYIGVLIFDNSFQWAVPIRHAEDKSLIRRLISGITPDGGTQIAPALAEAYRRVLPSKATFKHIVLLTDGISEEGDSLDLAREASAHQVTISTVGLGQDVNRSYLEKVALTSGGRSYFLNEPQGLEQILLKDVKDYSGSTAVEKLLTPLVVHHSEVLEDVGIESAPPLKGYARFVSKPTADTVLNIDPTQNDPLYVRWQYGLGRAAVFTSDAKSRWAESWVTWPGFDRFWINITRDLLSHSSQSEASAHFDTANENIEVTYRLGPAVTEPKVVPEIFVIGPNGFKKPIQVTKTAQRLYTGTLQAGRLRGFYRIRPVNETLAFPEIGLYQQEQELQDRGTNERLLAQISNFTGGRFNPALSSVFDSGGRVTYTSVQFWPAMLGLAIALSIVELISRKWFGLVSQFRRV